MHTPAFQTAIASARIEDLQRARGTSIQPHNCRKDSNSRPSERWGLLNRAGIRRLVFADPSRAN